VLVRSCVICLETQLEAMERVSVDTMLIAKFQVELETHYQLLKEVASDALLPRCTFMLVWPEVANTFMLHPDRDDGMDWCRAFALNRTMVPGNNILLLHFVATSPCSRKSLA
jgi:hypothetical protein